MSESGPLKRSAVQAEREGPQKSTGINTEEHEEIKRWIQDLVSSDDPLIRYEASTRLQQCGELAAMLITENILKRHFDSETHPLLAGILGNLGRCAIPYVSGAIRQIQDLKRPNNIYILDCLIDVLGKIKDQCAVEPLVAQLERLNLTIRENHDNSLTDLCEAAKIRIHNVLSELGSVACLDDLIAMLGDGYKRIREGVIDALAKIGDKRALVPLIRLYNLELDISYSGAKNIKHAFREIVRREKILPRDPVFEDITHQERLTLEKFLYPKLRSNGQGEDTNPRF